MKIFVCCRSIDRNEAKSIIDDLLITSENSVAILQEITHTNNWKVTVENKIQESDFVIFFLGSDTFRSQHLIWEYSKAKVLNKHIVGYKLHNASEDSILFCQGFPVFDKIDHCFKYISKVFEDDRVLKLEQYKMMFESTQKVTEQRLTVNNLFFTLTASIISVAAIVGKTFEFSVTGTIGMLLLTILALIVTYYWEKLINSYGRLNTGKFKVIDKIEKQLRTNMFEDEWKILLNDVKYESNTETEKNIVKNFRMVIYVVVVAELVYLIVLFLKNWASISIVSILGKLLLLNNSCNC
jgi:hypothetical protein